MQIGLVAFEVHHVFSQFSGTCIRGSDGHCVAGKFAGEIRQLVESFAVWTSAAAVERGRSMYRQICMQVLTSSYIF